MSGAELKQPTFNSVARAGNIVASPATDLSPDIQSARSTAELSQRPSRAPDYAAENHAIAALARTMASAPDGILQELASAALALCRADSSGVSLLTDADNKTNFHWP